jgi:hypothetical protein
VLLLTINESMDKIICSAFGIGRIYHFQALRASEMMLAEKIECLADRGYQGLIEIHNSRPTVCVTRAGAGMDSAWEQEKLEARKMLESAAESPASRALFVG